jgi:hypothetical protein
MGALVTWGDMTFLLGFPLTLAYAYAFAAVPSLLFTLAMEFLFSRGLSPTSWATVGLASALGLASGGLIALVCSLAFRQPGAYINLLFLGLFAGAIEGLLIVSFSRTKVRS